jgi:hypothetical protein
MELDLDLLADGLEVATPRAPSKKAQGKRKEGATGTFQPQLPFPVSTTTKPLNSLLASILLHIFGLNRPSSI